MLSNDSQIITECREELIENVIGCAIEVHKTLGPGLLESAYELALTYELSEKNFAISRQVDIPINYKGKHLGTGFKEDLIIENSLLLELKAVDSLNNIYTSQLITYLKLMRMKRGLLINFNTRLLKNGLKRISL